MKSMPLDRLVSNPTVAGASEMVRTGGDGWPGAPGHVYALADSLSQVLDADIHLLHQAGRGGHHCVMVGHDIDAEAAKLRALLKGSA